jgi:hypothetical protein
VGGPFETVGVEEKETFGLPDLAGYRYLAPESQILVPMEGSPDISVQNSENLPVCATAG